MWTRNAADQGDCMAQFNLAVLLDVGDNLARDRLKSIEGSGLYAMCEGICQDKAEAARYYRKAAEQGHASAAFALAGLYGVGDGVEHNTALAEWWYQRAREVGRTGARGEWGRGERAVAAAVPGERGAGIALAANSRTNAAASWAALGAPACRGAVIISRLLA